VQGTHQSYILEGKKQHGGPLNFLRKKKIKQKIFIERRVETCSSAKA